MNLKSLNVLLGKVLIIVMILTILSYWFLGNRDSFIHIFIILIISLTFLPFLIIAFVSILKRDKHPNAARNGIGFVIFMLVAFPLFATYFVDWEVSLFSGFGLILSVILWFKRRNEEIQLLVLNIFGALVWLFFVVVGILALFTD